MDQPIPTPANFPTREEWEAYEIVRVSGVTNMLMTRTVAYLAGIDRQTVLDCIKHYAECKKLYA